MSAGDPDPARDGKRLHGGGQNRRLTIRIIYNPRTGEKRRKRFRAVVSLLEREGHNCEVLTTSKAGDAARFAHETLSRSTDILAVAGGDGTVNDALQGIGPQSPPLGVIPLGTANVLAHELGIGTEPHRIARCLIEANVLTVQPGLVNGHRFMMMAGIGLDAQVVSDLRRSVKTRFGKAAYLIEVFRTLRRWSCPRLDFRADGKPLQAATIIVSRGKRYGGTYVLAPDCDLATPMLGVTCIPGKRALSVFGRFLLIPAGLLVRCGLATQRLVRTIEVTGPAGDPIQADGDVVAHVPARISLCGQLVKLCVPKTGG